MMQALVLLFVVCLALVPWVLPPPSRWLDGLLSLAAGRRPPQAAVRYVYVCRPHGARRALKGGGYDAI